MTRLLMTMTVLLSGCVTAQTPPCNPPPWASAPDERPFVRAVSIGWNRVNPSAYNGWSGALTDCELDAEMWAGTWREAGIETVCLLTEEATIERCRVTLKSAVETLRAGDTHIRARGPVRRRERRRSGWHGRVRVRLRWPGTGRYYLRVAWIRAHRRARSMDMRHLQQRDHVPGRARVLPAGRDTARVQGRADTTGWVR